MRIMVIPDCQVKPGVSTEHLEWAGKYAVDKRPDVIVNIGDFWDMPSLSSYDKGKKSFEGRRYTKDIEAGCDAMETFMGPIWMEQQRLVRNKEKQWNPRLVFTIGNHECLDDSAEVLTDSGWKNITDVCCEDKVLTMGDDVYAEWQHPSSVFAKDYTGPMYEINTGFMSIRCTEGHRFYTRTTTGNRVVKEAKDLTTDYRVHAAVFNDTLGESFSDDDLSLAAWFVTDSHFSPGRQIILYQRESNAHKIRDLLNRLEIKFSERTRHRDITHVCGKRLKKPCEAAVEFYISVDVAHALGVYSNKELPSWTQALNDRQWGVFLDTLIEADGSMPTGGTLSRVFYGKKPICDDVQAAAVAHGWSASITEYRANQFRVNLTKRPIRRVADAEVVIEEYSGLVYCLEVANGNFMMRRNGKAHITGNCRIERAIQDDAKLEGLISYDDFGLEQLGWEVWPFLSVVAIEGVVFSHYFTSGIMGRPVSSAKALLTKKHMSAIMGHVQDRDIAFDKKADGTAITAIFVGIFYQHDEDYLGQQGNNSWKGIWMLNDVKDGSFDEMPVSLEYLRRKYGGQ